MDHDLSLRKHLTALLEMRGAHLTHAPLLDDWPAALRGRIVEGVPYSAWQLLEHMRIAQRDMIDFSRSSEYKEKKFPDDYWPQEAELPDDGAWDRSVAAFRSDLKEMIGMVNDSANDLFAEIPWGDGHTLLREALQVADHNAYHLGQLVILHRHLSV